MQYPDNIDPQFKGSYRQRNRLATPLIRWWLFVLFVCLYLILFLPKATYPSLAIITLIPTSLALWFGLLSLIGNDGTRKLYDPITLFNTGLFYYSLKGVGLSWGDTTSFLSHIGMPRIAGIYPQVVLLTTLGILTWNWGYHTSGRWHIRKRIRSARDSAGRWNYVYLNPRLGRLFLVFVGTLSFFFLIRATGEGPLVFLVASWKRGYLSNSALAGTSSAFSSVLLPGVLLLPLASILWLAILGNNQQRPGVVFWVYTLLMLIVVFLVMPRATMLNVVLSLLFVYHYTIRRISLAYLAVFGVLGLTYVYAMGLWRIISYSAPDLDQVGVMLLKGFSGNNLVDFFFSGAISDIRTFVLVVNHYGVDLPFQFGGTLIRMITQFIPRALWPSKPIDLGVELGSLSNPYTLSGTPAGFLPEMYINFQVLGVIIGAFLLGVLFNQLYRRLLLSHQAHVLSIVIYAITIPRILLLPSNTIALAFVSWAIPVGAALLATWLCTLDGTSERQISPISSRGH